MNSLILTSDEQALDIQTQEWIHQYRQASSAQATKKALIKNWSAFERFCKAQNLTPLPCTAGVLESFLVHLARKGLTVASIEQAKWAVDSRHKMASLPLPGQTASLLTLLAGIKRKHGRPPQKKEALTIDHIRRVPFESGLKGKRDKALLLLGFAGGFRRSELAAIQVEHIQEAPYGVRILIPQSKGDPYGRGEGVDIVYAQNLPGYCPVLALKDWLKAAAIQQGRVFRSIHQSGQMGSSLSTVSIGKTVKWAAECCGLDPRHFGGHSLRSGCATYLLDKAVPLNVVSKQLRHKRADTTLRYDRNATAKALTGIY